MDTAGAIAYRNLAYYLTPSSQFIDARLGAVISAEDLYGTCSNEVQQVINAWYAVGVGPNGYTEDFQAIAGTSFSSDCDLGSSETIELSFRYNPRGCNSTLSAGDTIVMNYELNSILVSENYILTTLPQFGDTITFTFNTKADLSQKGIYSLNYWLSYKNDEIPVNDSITGVEVRNTFPLNDSINFINFEPNTPYDTHSYFEVGNQGSAERRPGVAANQSLFGLRLTSLYIDPGTLNIPDHDSDNFKFNAHYGASLCACVEASTWSNVRLSFDLKQTFSEIYAKIPGIGQDIPELVSSLRVTVNGTQIGNQYHPTTYKSDPYLTQTLNLDAYAGTDFKLCFEGRHFIPVTNDTVQGSPGDNSYLDNIIISDITNISVSELALPEFKVFPNPANNEVFITLKNIKGTITLLNNLGQVIEEKQVDYSTTNLMMDVSTLSAGMYIVQIMNGNDQSTEKLIIE
jgi:hypothetical protein